MLMVRLQRIGRKNDPSFRMVVLEKASGPKAGTNVEVVGTYNPKTKQFAAQGDRIKHWISMGAQLSPSLSNLLIDKKIIEGKKVNVLPKKSPIKKDEPEAAAAPAAAEATSEEVVEAAIAEAEPAPEEVVAEAAPAVEEAPAEVAAETPAEEAPAA
ncbi:MAG: 30S ribosomal protein S16 [Candidatus Pacebacteria bacterium]|nr:30S ribosomal protein S16 [Candidatus Paceibacterota bacterium]